MTGFKEVEQVQGYGFADFLEKIEKMINEGWRLDFSTNENYPTSFGTFYSVGMVKLEEVLEAKPKGKKSKEVPVQEIVTETAQDTTPVQSDLSPVEMFKPQE